MELGLREKVVLVTGASSGIGRAIAEAFADEGARVAVGFHSHADAARTVVDRISDRHGIAIPWQLDLGEPTTLDSAVEHARELLGPIDVLVNNAVKVARLGPRRRSLRNRATRALRRFRHGQPCGPLRPRPRLRR